MFMRRRKSRMFRGMKSFHLLVTLMLAFQLAFQTPVWAAPADWSNPILLNSTGNSATTNAHGMVVDGNTLHVVILQNGNRVAYRRSTDNGATWSTAVQLTSSTSASVPCMARSGTVLHVAWLDNRSGSAEVYYIRSRDGGLTWDPEQRLTVGLSGYRMAIAAWGSYVHITSDDQYGTKQLYYKRSTDGGDTWDSIIALTSAGLTNPLTGGALLMNRPSIAVYQNFVHIAYEDGDGINQPPGNYPFYRVHYIRSADNGATWGADLLVTGTTWAYRPAIAASPETGEVYLGDTEESGYDPSTQDLYLRKSTDNGQTWLPKIVLSNAPFEQGHISISASGSSVYTAWMDRRFQTSPSDDSHDAAYYTGSTDGGATWSPEERVPGTSGSWLCCGIAAAPRYAHVLTTSFWTGPDLYYSQRYTGNTDANANGMADAWEIHYFQGTNSLNGGPTNDWDSDGCRNLDEYIAGTDPTNRNSRFQLAIDSTNGLIEVQFPAVGTDTNYFLGFTRHYKIEQSTNLLLTNGWSGIQNYTNIPGADQMAVYTNGTPDSTRFYRAKAWLK
jgi:hypothetical protein